MCLKMKYAIVLLAAAVVLTARAQQPAAVDEYAGLTDEQIVHRGLNYASAKNYAEAYRCFSRAAQHGYDVAQFNLGQCYRLGHGVKPDTLKAVDYYKMAAMQGQEEAQYNLAECYMQGYGVQRDSIEAEKWYRKAAELGVTEAAFKLGLFYASTGNYGQALKYYRQAADKDHPEAIYNLGMLYFNGQGAGRDLRTAFVLLKRAATLGVVDAQFNLALCYGKGLGTPVNRDMALHWLREAARGGDASARQALKTMGLQ